MATTQELITIKVHTDDDTGLYYVGELDYGVPVTTKKWLSGERNSKSNRESLAEWLEHLAKSCRDHRSPFGDHHINQPNAECEAKCEINPKKP